MIKYKAELEKTPSKQVGGQMIKPQELGGIAGAFAYNRAHPKEVEASNAAAKDNANAAFNSWASNIEGRMGGGYKMNRDHVRNRMYTDPATNKPYSEDQGYDTFNRSRAKDQYYKAFKGFNSTNRVKSTSGLRGESDKAFYKDYPKIDGQSYGKYNELKEGAVAMYKDPAVFGNQQSAWKSSQTKATQPKQTYRTGGVLYKKK